MRWINSLHYWFSEILSNCLGRQQIGQSLAYRPTPRCSKPLRNTTLAISIYSFQNYKHLSECNIWKRKPQDSLWLWRGIQCCGVALSLTIVKWMQHQVRYEGVNPWTWTPVGRPQRAERVGVWESVVGARGESCCPANKSVQPIASSIPNIIMYSPLLHAALRRPLRPPLSIIIILFYPYYPLVYLFRLVCFCIVFWSVERVSPQMPLVPRCLLCSYRNPPGK